MNEIILRPRGGGGGDLTVIRDTLASYESDFAFAKRCSEFKATLPAVVDLATARVVRAKLLPSYDQIYLVWRSLGEITSDDPRHMITEVDAVRMLGYLFGALNKRSAKGDVASLLAACVAMITDDSALAEVTGVKPLPRHPAVLALAIHKVISTSIFPPAPVELGKAMFEVRDRIRVLQFHVWQVLDIARKAERIVFREDREAWLLPYASGEMPISHAVSIVDDADDEWASAVNDLIPDE
jgi:hypothetical protein